MTENVAEKPKENGNEDSTWQEISQNDAQPNQMNLPSQQIAEDENKQRETENRFNDFLKAIGNETSQLNDYLVEEKRLTSELCNLITHIIKCLRISFSIAPGHIANLRNARQVKLDPNGRLVVIEEGQDASPKPLEEYAPDVILSVMLVVIPELEKAVKTYRKRISQRVSLLEKMKLELRNLQIAVSPEKRGSAEQLKQIEEKHPVIPNQ